MREALCIDNSGFEESLIKNAIYSVSDNSIDDYKVYSNVSGAPIIVPKSQFKVDFEVNSMDLDIPHERLAELREEAARRDITLEHLIIKILGGIVEEGSDPFSMW